MQSEVELLLQELTAVPFSVAELVPVKKRGLYLACVTFFIGKKIPNLCTRL